MVKLTGYFWSRIGDELMSDPGDKATSRFFKVEVFAFVFAIIVQSATGIWWLSSVETRINGIDKAVNTLIEDKATYARQAVDVARIDERTKDMDAALSRIERAQDVDNQRGKH